MPTVDEFRAALNDVATGTAPLASDHLLRAVRRLRRRRRVLTGCGTALAVAGMATGAALLAAPTDPRPAPAAQPSLSAGPHTDHPADPPIDRRLLEQAIEGAAQHGDKVIDSVVHTDGPDGGLTLTVRRDPAAKAPPPAGSGATLHHIGGTSVRISPQTDRRTRYEWFTPSGTYWSLTCDRPLGEAVVADAVAMADARS